MIKSNIHYGIVFLINKDSMIFGMQDDSGDYDYQALYCFEEEEREKLKIGDIVETYYLPSKGRKRAIIVGKGRA